MTTTTIHAHYHDDDECEVEAVPQLADYTSTPYVRLSIGDVHFYLHDPESLAAIAHAASQHVNAFIVARREFDDRDLEVATPLATHRVSIDLESV